MNYLLPIAILLLIILSFGFKEGYYSDMHTSAASTSMTTLISKLTIIKDDMTKVSAYDLTLDAQSKLTPLLTPNSESTFNNTIIEQATRFSNRISEYQDDLIKLSNALQKVEKMPVELKEGTFPLSVAIQKLLTEAQTINKELNQIPDS
jgi:hypothetical protein